MNYDSLTFDITRPSNLLRLPFLHHIPSLYMYQKQHATTDAAA